jgi:hypothetical protein
MSSSWCLLSTGQVKIGTWGNSLLACMWWSNLLFSPGSSWVALLLQLCLVSSSPSKVEQFTLSTIISSRRLAQQSTIPTLGGWLVTPSPLSAFIFWNAFVYWEFSSLLYPCSPRVVQHSTLLPLLVIDYISLFMLFSFVWGGFNLPRDCTGLCFHRVSRGVACGVCYWPIGSQIYAGSTETGLWG